MSSFWTALALTVTAAHAWTIPSLHVPSIQSRTTHIRLQLQPDEEPAIFVPAAATGEDVDPDADDGDGGSDGDRGRESTQGQGQKP